MINERKCDEEMNEIIFHIRFVRFSGSFFSGSNPTVLDYKDIILDDIISTT